MKTAFHFLVFALLFVGILAVCDFARMAFMRWRWNKQMAKRVNDVAWRHWIGLVKIRMESVNVTHSANIERIVAQDAEWFHDLWMKDFVPAAAVEKWLAEKNAVAK